MKWMLIMRIYWETTNQRDLRSGIFLFLLGPEWKCVCVEDYEDTHSILIWNNNYYVMFSGEHSRWSLVFDIRRGRALNDNNRSLTWINFKLTYTGIRSLNCRRRMEKSTIIYILNIYVRCFIYSFHCIDALMQHWWFFYIEILLENYAEIVDRSSSSPSSTFCIYSGWWFDYTEISSFPQSHAVGSLFRESYVFFWQEIVLIR